MIISLVALATLSGTTAVTPASVAEALRAGCKVQQTHTPAGKPVTSPPIIRCSKAAQAKLRDMRGEEAVAR